MTRTWTWLVALALLLAPGLQQPRLFRTLPEYAVTPGGMAVAPDGALVVACPNFASYPPGGTRPAVPACFLRIDLHHNLNKWFDRPVLAETVRACPMGIAFGARGERYVADHQNWPTGNGPDGETNQGRILRLRIERLIVSNFDAVFAPDKVDTRHHSPATLSVLEIR